jgi:HSP20 family molecular chaperone IbpA
MEELEREIKDRKYCEALLHVFLVDHSDIILVVVGILTFSDQLMIHKIRSDNSAGKDSKESKKVIIIHNFSTFISKRQVEQAVISQIEENFDVKKEYIPSSLLTSVQGSPTDVNKIFYIDVQNPNVIHTIMAMEGTEAGLHYNITTKQLIQSAFIENPNRRLFKPEQALSVYLQAALPKYINVPQEESLSVKYDPAINAIKMNVSNFQFRAVQFDILERQLNSGSKSETVKYELKATKSSLVFTLELAGMTDEEIQASTTVQFLKNQTGYYLVVKGNRLEECKDIKTKLESIRHFGEFEVTTRTLEYSQFDIAGFQTPEREIRDGLFLLRWVLRGDPPDPTGKNGSVF